MASAKHLLPQAQEPQISKFIVALFLVKSKPANISIRDYISYLHIFIRCGDRADSERNAKRHVHTVDFWKGLYQKSEAVQKDLQTKISELELQVETLSATVAKAALPPRAQAKRKRNANDSADSPNDRLGKAPRLAENVSGTKFKGLGLDTIDSDAVALGSEASNNWASTFLHDFQMLQRALSQRSTSTEAIADRFVHICLHIRRLIGGVETPMIRSTNTISRDRRSTTRTQEQSVVRKQTVVESQIETNLSMVARVFPFMLDSLERFGRMPQGRKLSGQLVYHVISILRDILERLCLLCATESRERHAATLMKRRVQGRALKQIADYLTPPSASSEAAREDNMTNVLFRLSIIMTDALRPSRVADCDILDGFLFFLLNRAGSLLQGFVFCDYNKENENQCSGSGMGEAAMIREAQAPHVLRLLKHVVVLAPKETALRTPIRSGSRCGPSLRIRNSQRSRSSISTKARFKLQNTLLKAIFGEYATGLGDSLEEPLDLRSSVAIEEKGEEEAHDIGGWFKEEVWKAVGWDVLREIIAWK